jgi:prepilin-type N-terminal cleavage/methylation domain-containing protein
MWRTWRSAGFTLIELLVVVIIIAVLAAVGVPLLSANVERSQMTEGETGVGTLRTALRAYVVENNALPAAGTFVADLGFTATDFQGQYFESDDYALTGTTSITDYCIGVTGDVGGPLGGTAPSGGKVAGKTRSIDEFGTIRKTADCS